ncbi:NAD(P)-dependent oxidoreductase [Frondihabitans peucedani]|uniref:NAD(P)-dependent oxidoreductase n=2 Tax=Frondihabitans peucedani TaxID=598626 RepID=A0ABP8E162_9MICO
MGAPIAARLAAAGLEVAAFDPVVAPPAGVRQGRDAQDVAARADVLLTILPTTEVLRGATSGPGGALAALPGGAVWVDCTSADPRVYGALAAEAAALGLQAVAAPLAGGPADAAAGTLGFYLSGAPAAVGRIDRILSVLGRPERRLLVGSDPAAAHTAKLLANTLWFGQAVAAAEVLLLGRALGLQPGLLGGILRSSPGASAFLEHDLDALLDGDYLASFGIDRVVEELDTVAALAEAAGTPHDVTAVVAGLHRAALDAYGPVDGELLAVRLLEDRAGARLRREGSREV